jgi:hypothetical protein
MVDCFGELGLEAGADERAVKRAYAKRLKQIDSESAPEEFQKLRQAYEEALWHAKHTVTDADWQPPIDSVDGDGADVTPTEAATEPSFVESAIATQAPVRQTGWSSLSARNDDELLNSFIAETLRKIDTGGTRDVAVTTIYEAQQHPTLASFAAQEEFELKLAMSFGERESYSGSVLLGVADAMGWTTDMQRLFTLNRGLAAHVGNRIIAAQALERLQSLKQRQHMAGRVLLGKFRPRVFRFAIFDNSELENLNIYLGQLRWVDFQGLVGAPDQRVIDWWLQNGPMPRITFNKALLAVFTTIVTVLVMAEVTAIDQGLSAHGIWRIVQLWGAGCFAGLLTFGLTVGIPWLAIRFRSTSLSRLATHPVFRFGWIVAMPITLAVSLLWPRSASSIIPILMCLSTLVWIKLALGLSFRPKALAVEALMAVVLTLVFHGYFRLSNLALAIPLSALTGICSYALISLGKTAFEPKALAWKRGIQYLWIPLLVSVAFAVCREPAPTDISHQLLRTLWLITLIWGMAVSSFYSGALLYVPVAGTFILSLFVYSAYFASDAPGTEGLSFMVAASIVTGIFFVANRIPAIDLRLRD